MRSWQALRWGEWPAPPPLLATLQIYGHPVGALGDANNNFSSSRTNSSWDLSEYWEFTPGYRQDQSSNHIRREIKCGRNRVSGVTYPNDSIPLNLFAWQDAINWYSLNQQLYIGLGEARYLAGGFREQTIARQLILADFHLKKLWHPHILIWEFGSDQLMRLGKPFRMGSWLLLLPLRMLKNIPTLMSHL